MDFAFFGYIGVCFSGTQLIPEVYKAFRTKHLRDIAWPMLFLFFIGSISWTFYGYYIEDLPLIVSATLNSCASAMLIMLKQLYRKNDKPIVPVKFRIVPRSHH